MSALSERIGAKASELARRAMAEMVQSPFWQERFGSRGQELSDADGQLHLPHLIQALNTSQPAVLTEYALGLQTSLVSRGMCSRHIDESFERLARVIRDEISEPEAALELLRAARQALIYEGGPARELMLCAEPLSERVVDALRSRQPSWFSAASSYPSLAAFESLHQAERARCKSDVLDYIAYLADALHGERPELFVAHAVWMHGFTARRQGPGARVEETLSALSDCLPAAPGAAAATARRASGAGTASGSEARASQAPAARRPPLSQPPPPPVPLAASPELAASAQAALGAAIARLTRDADGAQPPAEGVGP